MMIAAVCVLALVLAVVVARRRFTMVTVDGPSMQPALEPGDRVLMRRGHPRRIRPGQLVVARKPWPGQRWTDPQPGPLDGATTWLIKRVADTDPTGGLWLLGDNAAQSWDSRQWGPCPTDKVHGVVLTVFRTAPEPTNHP
ncbi:MAG: S26 family signal peptidase [Actinoplanes sp.]